MLTVKGRVGFVLEGRTLGSAGDTDDIRRVAAAGSFGVEAVDRPALHRGDRVGEEAGLVQRVGVDGDLDVVLVGYREARVDDRGRGAPVFVQLEAAARRLRSGRAAAWACCRCLCRAGRR